MKTIDPIKPKNEMKKSDVRAHKDRLIVQRKYNGCRSTCTVDDKGVRMWSRSFSTVTNERIEYTGKVPHIVKELQSLGLPSNTVLDGELVSFRGGDREFFDDTKSATGGHDSTCVAFQESTGHYLTWIVFDCPIYDGQQLHEQPYRDRYEQLEKVFNEQSLSWIRLIENEPFKGAPDDYKERARKLKIEGYVAKNVESTYPLTTFGKTRKPSNTWWKLVPDKMADVVVTGFELGTPGSKFEDVVGKLVCIQKDLDGNEFEVCKVGTGFTESERARLLTETYPRIGMVQYRYRRDDNNKLIHPSWKGFRDDKTKEECIIEELL